jgi:uncharacterized coiled-coil protein SlyX
MKPFSRENYAAIFCSYVLATMATIWHFHNRDIQPLDLYVAALGVLLAMGIVNFTDRLIQKFHRKQQPADQLATLIAQSNAELLLVCEELNRVLVKSVNRKEQMDQELERAIANLQAMKKAAAAQPSESPSPQQSTGATPDPAPPTIEPSHAIASPSNQSLHP